MRVLSTWLLSGLALLGVSAPVTAQPQPQQTVLEIFQPHFQDPSTIGALLQLDVQHACVSNIQVTVHVPTNSTFESNAHFVGAPFFDKLVHGTSLRNGVTIQTDARVSWDGTNLTFSGFVAGQASSAGSRNSSTTPWVHINFDIPDLLFTSQQVPLTLVLNSDVPPGITMSAAQINLVNPEHFTAIATNDPCIDGQVQGDPVFAGFQGQVYQFHGLPDEHFNLISSPDIQLNSHFVYLSSGKCDYTDTPCFSHAGTYMDALGLSVADARVKVVAGTHQAGLRVWVNDEELRRGAHMRHLTNNVTTSQLTYHHNGHLEIQTDMLRLEIVNSDMFFNIRAGLNDKELLRVGATKHTVTDHAICKTNTETSNYQLVEQTVAKKYDVMTPLHGLIGQTWRNVKVCGRDWMGTVEDYLVSDLFASDSHYNYFNW